MVTKLKTKKKEEKKEEKKETLSDFLLRNVRKDYGKESVIKMSEKSKKKALVSTGYAALDEALGIDGLPGGRIIEIYGPEASGKTTLMLHLAAEFQKIGGQVVFEDAEHALDLEYAKSLGVNVDEWILNQPDNGEQVFDLTEKMIKLTIEYNMANKTNKPLLVIADSVAAMAPKAELDGTLEDGTGAGLGAHARMMSQGLRRLIGSVGNPNVIVAFINQTRSKIGGYGSPITTTGGNALKFYASIRLEIKRGLKYEEGGEHIGHEFKIKVVKNKVAPPFRECTGLIRFGIGIDKIWPIFTLLKSENIISRGNKGWLKVEEYPNLSQFAGYKGFRKTYEENKDIFDSLYKEALGSNSK